jgi:hypothetical protein
MKIVVCQHPEVDYLGATVTIGLYEAGHGIYELPYVKHLHGQTDDWYTLADGKRGCSGPPGFIADNPLPPNEKDEEEILEAVKTADLIICHSTRRYVIEALEKIIARLGKVPNNLVICNGEDSDYIPSDLLTRYKPAVYFHREMYAEHSLKEYSDYCPVPIFPLQFGAPTRNMPQVDDTKKIWDFVLTLGNTHPGRLHLLEACLKANIPNSYIGGNGDNPLRAQYPQMRDMLGWKDYMIMVAMSKATANYPGYGRDTLNFWERAMWETFMLYVPPKLHIPFPFKDKIHCRYIKEDEFPLLGDILWTFLVSHEDWRINIAKAGKEWCHKHHSTKARATYLVNIATRLLGGEKIEYAEFGLEG